MLPKANSFNNDGLVADFTEVTESSKTYKIDTERMRLVGFCDNREAMEQAIRKIIDTQRFNYMVYSSNYGIELDHLFGQPIPFVYSELKRLIIEALEQDDRVKSVENFEFSKRKNKVSLTFTVYTVEGVIDMTKEITV